MPACRPAPTIPDPPLVLAIETATLVCGVAVLRGGELVLDIAFTPAKGHGPNLMPAVDAAVRLAGVPKTGLSAIAVSRGPGSFTGLRVGLATAKGLALGLSIPLYGVCTLRALAEHAAPIPGETVAALMDARKGQVFVAVYRRGPRGLEEIVPPAVLHPASLPGLVPAEAIFTGDARRPHGAELQELYGRALHWAPDDLAHPWAAAVGRLALPLLSRGEPSELATLAPAYLRPSDAELNYGPSRPAAV